MGRIPLISVTRALAGGFDPFYSLVTVKESVFLVSVFSGKIREFEGRCGSLAQERGRGHFTDHKYHSGLKKIRESWELNISTGVKIKQSLPQTKQFQYITREKWQSQQVLKQSMKKITHLQCQILLYLLNRNWKTSVIIDQTAWRFVLPSRTIIY